MDGMGRADEQKRRHRVMLNGAGGECGDVDGVGGALARSDGRTARLGGATWEDRMGPARLHRRAKEAEDFCVPEDGHPDHKWRSKRMG
jgi:hypothetical protein